MEKHEKDWIEWSSPEVFPTQGTTINSRSLGICVVTETKIADGRKFLKVAYAPVASAAGALGSITSTRKTAQNRINGSQPKKKKP